MYHTIKLCIVALMAALGLSPAVRAQCFVCSDATNSSSVGSYALYSNTSGANNTAFGYQSLYSNTSGKGNAAQGVNALYSNTTGIRNLAIGSNALYGNVSGGYNVALGFDAGYNQTTGSDNIYINNVGVSGESQTLRLGTQGASGVQGSGILTAYVAGVATSQVTGSAVYITSSGQLGVLASSERFKTDVKTIADSSDKLSQLRPVTFTLKADSQQTLQYGLIAEEVAKIFPEMVIHGADGRIDGVRYEELTPLLLRELQVQQGKIRELERRQKQLSAQSVQFVQMQRQMLDMRAALNRLQGEDALVARR